MTAVEWLEKQLNSNSIITQTLLKHAKEMEKKQTIKFAENYATSDCIYCSGEFGMNKDAGEYYDETFKNKT